MRRGGEHGERRRADAGVRGGTRVWPHEHEARRVCPAAHAVVPGPKAATDHAGDLRDLGARHGHDHLGAILRDPARLVLGAHHEARDVLQEYERDTALAAELDEVRALLGALREEDAVVRHDADGNAVQAREAAH